MHKKRVFSFILCSYQPFSLSCYLEPKSFSPAATLDPRPRHWTRDRTLDPRPRLWTRDRDFGPATRHPPPATRDPRLLVKLLTGTGTGYIPGSPRGDRKVRRPIIKPKNTYLPRLFSQSNNEDTALPFGNLSLQGL